MRDEFAVHTLNESGKNRAQLLAASFARCLDEVEALTGSLNNGRELALVRTKMEEACFFAKKAMAKQLVNQQQ